MERLNYLYNKKECEEFLQQFNFKYYVPELCRNNERYCVELTRNLEEVYFCSIEYTLKGKMVNQDIFLILIMSIVLEMEKMFLIFF